MARTNTKPDNQQQPKAPEFLAWHVMAKQTVGLFAASLKNPNNPLDCFGKGEKSFWNKLGAAWRHKDGKGYTLQFEVVPINGRIVLRQPLEVPTSGDGQNENGSA